MMKGNFQLGIIMLLLVMPISSAQFGNLGNLGDFLPDIGGRIIADPPKPVVPNSGSIYFSNHCSKPIELIFRYMRIDGQWETLKFDFDGRESAYLADSQNRIKTDNSIIYYYARSKDGRLLWDGDNERYFDGKTWRMAQGTLSVGDVSRLRSYTFGISCPSFDWPDQEMFQ